MPPVINLVEYKAASQISLLEELLAATRRGSLPTIAVIIKHNCESLHGSPAHAVSFIGEYKNDPLQLIGVIGRLKHILNERMDREAVMPSFHISEVTE